MIGDTILAVASAQGSSERAVLRLSGPKAVAMAALLLTPAPPRQRGGHRGSVTVLGCEVEAMALVMPAPASYTGEDCVELQLPGSPLLLALLQDELLRRGTGLGLRLATPGEFTRRACEHGKLDLLQAEGVLAMIAAVGADDARAAAALLHGDASRQLQQLRELLQTALALLESGLDFGDGDTGAVPRQQWLEPLQQAEALVDALHRQLPAASSGGEVLLLGAANAGKSSLCNALAGRDAVLVGAEAGTTRDVVRVEIGKGVCLWDAPGDLLSPATADAAAIALRDRLATTAAAALWVVEPAAPMLPPTQLPVLAVVCTKSDLGGELPAALGDGLPRFAVSSTTGRGIAELRAFLQARCQAGVQAAAAPLRQVIAQVRESLQRARAAADAGEELVALELHEALRGLQPDFGAHSAEPLLDRIFARFCLGK